MTQSFRLKFTTGLRSGLLIAALAFALPTAQAQKADEHAAHHPNAVTESAGADSSGPAGSQSTKADDAATSGDKSSEMGGMKCDCMGMMQGEGMMGKDKGMMSGGMMMGKDKGMMGAGDQGMMGSKSGKMKMMSGGKDMMAGKGMMDQNKGTMSGGMMMGKDKGMMSGSMMKERKEGMGMMGDMPMMKGRKGEDAPHLYHIAARTFFLERSSDVALTPDQQSQLRQIREDATLDHATRVRQIDQLEQELWVLTGSDTPSQKRIEAKMDEIGLRTADMRFAWFRAAEKAVDVLTPEQRNKVIGVP